MEDFVLLASKNAIVKIAEQSNSAGAFSGNVFCDLLTKAIEETRKTVQIGMETNELWPFVHAGVLLRRGMPLLKIRMVLNRFFDPEKGKIALKEVASMKGFAEFVAACRTNEFFECCVTSEFDMSGLSEQRKPMCIMPVDFQSERTEEKIRTESVFDVWDRNFPAVTASDLVRFKL